MSNQEIVLQLYPSAIVVTDEPQHKKDIPCFLIIANENGVIKLLGSSSDAEEATWKDAKENLGDL
jgi:hypothetical protein